MPKRVETSGELAVRMATMTRDAVERSDGKLVHVTADDRLAFTRQVTAAQAVMLLGGFALRHADKFDKAGNDEARDAMLLLSAGLSIIQLDPMQNVMEELAELAASLMAEQQAAKAKNN